jgi:hypothetical protein
MLTPATGARCVARVYRYHWHARKPRFVFDKCPEFVKRPFAKPLALGLPNRYPKACQILHRYGFLRASGRTHDLFRNGVIRIAFKPALSARDFLQVTLRRLRSFALQFLFELLSFSPDPINIFSAVDVRIGIGGEINYAKINPR